MPVGEGSKLYELNVWAMTLGLGKEWTATVQAEQEARCVRREHCYLVQLTLSPSLSPSLSLSHSLPSLSLAAHTLTHMTKVQRAGARRRAHTCAHVPAGGDAVNVPRPSRPR